MPNSLQQQSDPALSSATPSGNKQSSQLVARILPLLAAATILGFFAQGFNARTLLLAITGLTFAAVVWLLRAATPAAAASGAVIAFLVGLPAACCDGPAGFAFLVRSALTPLLALFVLTFAATRAGRPRQLATASVDEQREARHGRNAAQIIANLGTAALLGGSVAIAAPHSALLASCGLTLVLAALAEATADTVSSELGRRFGGTPRLLTTLRPVPAGTDGAVSLLGTLTGIFAAALVSLTGALALDLTPRKALIALAAATAGLFFDSLLGATLERRHYLNNDLVNFVSTLFAALTALLLSLPTH